LKKKQQDKYSPELEKEAREWIEAVTGEKLTSTFAESLKSGRVSLRTPSNCHLGVVLCNLINKIKPDTIKKVNKNNMAFSKVNHSTYFINMLDGEHQLIHWCLNSFWSASSR
jgi:hypothetical protein